MSRATDNQSPTGAAPGALELAALATAAIPGMQVLGVKEYATWEQGACVTVVDADGGDWQVLSLPDALGRVELERMFRVLSVLGEAVAERRLPFGVPSTRGVVDRKTGAVIVFPHLGGDPGTELLLTGAEGSDVAPARTLASSLGGALAALHNLPTGRFESFLPSRGGAEQRRSELLELVRAHSTVIPSELRERWIGALRDQTLWQYQPALVHGALSAESLQVASGGAVVGVRGFDQARLDDPAVDCVWLTFLADDVFIQRFDEAYTRKRAETDLHLMTRAQLLAELETLKWYDQAVRAGDAQWRADGAGALREMALELGGQLLVPPQVDVVHIEFTADEEPLLRVNPHLREDSDPGTLGAAPQGPADGPADTSATVASRELPAQ